MFGRFGSFLRLGVGMGTLLFVGLYEGVEFMVEFWMGCGGVG